MALGLPHGASAAPFGAPMAPARLSPAAGPPCKHCRCLHLALEGLPTRNASVSSAGKVLKFDVPAETLRFVVELAVQHSSSLLLRRWPTAAALQHETHKKMACSRRRKGCLGDGAPGAYPELDMRRATLPRCTTAPAFSAAGCCDGAAGHAAPICSSGAVPPSPAACCWLLPLPPARGRPRLSGCNCAGFSAGIAAAVFAPLPRCGGPRPSLLLLLLGLCCGAPARVAATENEAAPASDSERRGRALRPSCWFSWVLSF